MSFDWENSKENFVPLKKGRKVEQEIVKNDAPSITRNYEEQIKKNLESKDYSKALDAFVQFYTWHRRTFNDVSKSKEILEVRSH
jgi:hypothetical protein